MYDRVKVELNLSIAATRNLAALARMAHTPMEQAELGITDEVWAEVGQAIEALDEAADRGTGFYLGNE